jgi:hypothetical protein
MKCNDTFFTSYYLIATWNFYTCWNKDERFYLQTLVNTATQSPYCYWTSNNVQQHLLQKFDSSWTVAQKEENVVQVDPTES